ncbi:hypothetical protein DVH24_021249 [Malus domestica]|uniref:DUF8039 domain-containing protein n=1 Tax=Malus domestica TaxID=3750 RepID=A0A498HTF8_MALDO|nr:hypothetical protein DVH24_021249 [Malus domestica]
MVYFNGSLLVLAQIIKDLETCQMIQPITKPSCYFFQASRTKCKLLNWTGTREVVALAEFASTNPQDLVHFVPFGPNHWKVWVLEILVSRINLPRPTREFFLLNDALLSTIAWPIEYIFFD